jgi:UDP-glucuronate 4-epimerase
MRAARASCKLLQDHGGVLATIVTGAAGFIGHHVCRALLARGEAVVGLDNLSDYYDVRLKQARLAQLAPQAGFCFHHLDIADPAAMLALFAGLPQATRVVHLAAQAGVRHSLVDPYAYVASNVMGHVTVLEAARRLPRLEHLVYASSSSVYGGNAKLPFAESDPVEAPVSLYAATKRADELISHAYGHLHGLPQTGLRFFTVYGPWGRPDMAYFRFAEAISRGEPITLYDHGALRRDFTFIDDIVAGLVACLDRLPRPGEAPRLFNIGNNRAEPVSELVRLLEQGLGRPAVVRSEPRPLVDVAETCADLSAIEQHVGYRPATPLALGVPRFVDWFVKFRLR